MGPPLCAQHLPGSDAHAGHAGSRWRRRYSIDDVGAHRNHYYMIPTTDLPLLDPVRDIPVIGNPLADPLQPDLTHLVNLGYGDPLQGWSTGPANVATGFGLFPPLSDIEKLPGLLLSGTEQGIQAFLGDVTGSGPNPVTLSIEPHPLTGTLCAIGTVTELRQTCRQATRRRRALAGSRRPGPSVGAHARGRGRRNSPPGFPLARPSP